MNKSVFHCLLQLIGLLCGAVVIAGNALAGVTVLAGATLFDGSGAHPLPDAVVIVRDDRIVDVGPARRVSFPAGSVVTDLRGKWIIPGLIDAHVHFFQSGGLYTRPDVIDLRHIRPYASEIATIRQQLPATLARYIASGVTSVVDLAGPAWTYDLRELAAVPAKSPRVALAGPALAPELRPGLDGDDAPAVVVRTPEQARRAVQELAARRPDLLKIWFAPSPDMDMEREFLWVYAAIDEAHRCGLRVAVHATKLKIAREMVLAGADILVHSIDDGIIEPELLSRMRARGVLYIPTLSVGRRYAEVLGQQLVLSPFEQAMGDSDVIASFDDLRWISRGRANRRNVPDNQIANENLLRVNRAGIRIAAGSDAGNIGSLHGPGLHHELELMVEAGLTPAQVLLSATRGGAEVMGRGNELGRLQPDMLADLLVLDANPLADIRNTRRIVLVMKGGQVMRCDPQALPGGCPE
jgi:imidazolonepropionase-like amidohydrolase